MTQAIKISVDKQISECQYNYIVDKISVEITSVEFYDDVNQMLKLENEDAAIVLAEKLNYPYSNLNILALYPPVKKNKNSDSPLHGYVAIVGSHSYSQLQNIFNDNLLDQQGKVSIIGFGPGDPELLTVKGDRILRNADVIFYDDLTNEDFLNTLNISKVYVGKRSGHHHLEQDKINQILLESARSGKKTVRLKGGDPMLFAHGGEEIEYLQKCFVDVEVIPGITTALAAAATLKTSLTQRKISSSVSFINGHAKNTIVPDCDTLVYYMGAHKLPQIGESLIKKGWAKNTPVLLVHNVSLQNEQIFETQLSQLTANFPTPLIAIIGDVTQLRHQQAQNINRTLTFNSKTAGNSFINGKNFKLNLKNINRVIFSSPEEIKLFVSQYNEFPSDIEYINENAETQSYFNKIFSEYSN